MNYINGKSVFGSHFDAWNKNILENLKFETRPMKFFIKIYLFAIHVLEKGLVFFIIEIDCNSLV